jgi:hypothetical protein
LEEEKTKRNEDCQGTADKKMKNFLRGGGEGNREIYEKALAEIKYL